MRAGRVGPKIPVPHEEGAWMMFKILAARQLDEAETVATKRALQLSGEISPDVQAAIREAGVVKDERKLEDMYDHDTLVKYGLYACSECDPCTEFDLDAVTRPWAVQQILEMNVRPLANASGSESNSSTENSHRNSESLTGSTSPA